MYTKNINELGILFKNGDQGAFEQIYNTSINWVRSDVYKHIKEADVDDCIQNIYVKVYKNIGYFDAEKGPFGAWFNTIVNNETINFARQYHTLIEENTDYAIDEEYFPEIADTRSTPEEVVENEEMKSILHNLLGEINESQKACISMIYLDELSYKETANILGISEGTVKSRVFNGLKKIRMNIESMKARGVTVFGVAPIPVFIWMLRNFKFAGTATEAASNWAAISGTAGVTTGAIASASSGTASVVAATNGVAAKGFFAKIAAFSVKQKIAMSLAGLVLVGGVVGGTLAITSHLSRGKEAEKVVAEVTVTPELTVTTVVTPTITIAPTPTEEPKEAVEEEPYQKACKFFDEEKWVEAKEIFVTISEYKDSKEKLAICDEKIIELANIEAYKLYLSYLNDNYKKIVYAQYYIDGSDYVITEPSIAFVDSTEDGIKEMFTIEKNSDGVSHVKINSMNNGELECIDEFEQSNGALPDEYAAEDKLTYREAIQYLLEKTGEAVDDYSLIAKCLDDDVYDLVYYAQNNNRDKNGIVFSSKNGYSYVGGMVCTIPVKGETKKAVIVKRAYEHVVKYEYVDNYGDDQVEERLETVYLTKTFWPSADKYILLHGDYSFYHNLLVACEIDEVSGNHYRQYFDYYEVINEKPVQKYQYMEAAENYYEGHTNVYREMIFDVNTNEILAVNEDLEWEEIESSLNSMCDTSITPTEESIENYLIAN